MSKVSKLPGLIILTLSANIVQLDYMGIGLSAPQIRQDLGFTPALLPWILGGYVLTYGSFLVLGGRLGDLYGRRRMLLLGLAIFGICSLATALMTTPALFLAARVFKGIGSALISSNALALQNLIFAEGEERNRSYGVSSLVSGIVSMIYLVSAGVLLSYSWRWLLFVNVPAVLIIIPMVLRYLPERSNPRSAPSFDVAGALLSVIAFGTLSLAISSVVRLGLSVPVALMFGAAIIAFGTLVRVESRHSQPLFPPRLFMRPGLIGVFAICFLWAASNTNYPLNLMLQDGLHYTPRDASFALIPAMLTGAAAAFFSARLPERIGLRLHLMSALAFELAGLTAYALMSPGDGYWTALLPAALIANVGFFGVWVSVRILAASGVSDADQGLASGAVVSMQQLGNAVGIPLLSAVLNLVVTQQGGTADARSHGFHWMFITAAGMILLAFVIALFFLPSRRRLGAAALSAPVDALSRAK